jgi:hypothetical protein
VNLLNRAFLSAFSVFFCFPTAFPPLFVCLAPSLSLFRCFLDPANHIARNQQGMDEAHISWVDISGAAELLEPLRFLLADTEFPANVLVAGSTAYLILIGLLKYRLQSTRSID